MSAVPQVEPSSSATTHQLYEQYGRQIYAYCLQRLRSREEAEDAVQTTFLNAFRALERGTVTEFQQAWLFKIAQNVCLERREASGRRAQLESPSDMQVLQDTAPAHAPQDSEQLIGVEDALQRIPANQRKAILLREWQGLSYREIGEELGQSQAAVEMLIFRARRSLAAALEQPGEAQTKKQRRVSGGRALNVGSLVTAIKTMFTGGAAVKAVAVAVTAGAAVVTVSAPTHSIVKKRLAPAHAATPAQTVAAVPASAPVVARPVKHVQAPVSVVAKKAKAVTAPAHRAKTHAPVADHAAATPHAVVSQPHAIPSLDPPSAAAPAPQPAPQPVAPAPAPAATTTAAPPADAGESGKKPKPKHQPPPKSGGGPPPPPPPPAPDPEPQPQPQPQPADDPAGNTVTPVDASTAVDPGVDDGTGKGKGRKDHDHGKSQDQGDGGQRQTPGGSGDGTTDPPAGSDPGGSTGSAGDSGNAGSDPGHGGDSGNGNANGNGGHGRGHGGDQGGGDQGPGQGQGDGGGHDGGKGSGGGHGHGHGH